ncbi:MAG TPA: SURF1 family protein [Methylophilaceae bacterium]|nr:SURF1 family protein [Methylophilaceae bacterium]
MIPDKRGTLNKAAQVDETRPRSTAALIVLAVVAALFFAGFAALGTWQVKRLSWKLDLIARVEQRAYSAPEPLPAVSRWPQVTAASDEYRHVRLKGSYLYDLTLKVRATTQLGSGYWLLTPLQLADGGIVFINRGFITPEGQDTGQQAGPADTAQPVVVTGLLRMSEPGGGFLRKNDPAHGRWYSRDIQAMANIRKLAHVAPFFVDADAGTAGTAKTGNGYPVGGLTVLHFHNNHLVYAITWYALALMVAGGAWWVVRDERRLRRRKPGRS